MNNIKKWLVGATASVVLLSASSCKKLEDFGDTNVDPNGSTQVLTSALLTNILGNMYNIQNKLDAGYFAQYFAEPTYPGSSRYNQPKFNFSGYYSGVMMDAQVIINKNSDPATAGLPTVGGNGANGSQIAIATILKNYNMWLITDAWGDIPYSEALKGVGNLYPKYDEQFDVYKSIISELTTAVDQFDEAGLTMRGDISTYNGNVAQWRKLANSIRMLAALRLSKRFPNAGEYAATEFAAALNSPYGHIETNADNFTLTFPGGNYRNPWFATGGSSDNGVSRTYTDLLLGLGDSRINSHASNTNGVPYGYELPVPASGNWAKILAPQFREETSPLVIINAASVVLAKSEAAERGWIAGDAKTWYDQGVALSFQQWNQALPGAYLTTGPANFNTGAGVACCLGANALIPGGTSTPGASAPTPTALSRIMLQQYIAFYPDGMQGWANWRRSENVLDGQTQPPAPEGPYSGVPNLKPTVFNTNSSGEIPRRFVYGTTEYSLNLSQLQLAIDRLASGDDSQDERVWWDMP